MEIKTNDIAKRLEITDPIVDVTPESAHVSEDGCALVACRLRVDAEDSYAGRIIIALDGQETSIALVPSKLSPSLGWYCGAAAYNNGLLFLHRRTKPSEDQTLATYLPRRGMQWGEPQALEVTPEFPSRVTRHGHVKQVMPGEKGFGFGDQIAWPVEASTGSVETSVESVAFFQPDIDNGQLNWSYWPYSAQPEGIIRRFFGKSRSEQNPTDFVRPNPTAFPSLKGDELNLPKLCSASFDGSRVLITCEGAGVVKKYGDRCAAISELRPDGSVQHLYLEDFTAADRPDGSKMHDYQARFVAGGRKVLLKSRYPTTDPWKGGFALFDVKDQSLTVCSGPKSKDYRGPTEIVGDLALFVDFDAENLCLTLDLKKIAFA